MAPFPSAQEAGPGQRGDTNALRFFNFSSDLTDEPAVQQVCHLFQQHWNRDVAWVLPRLGHDFVNLLDLGSPVSPLDAKGCHVAEGKAHPHGDLSGSEFLGRAV